jgi:histidine ammonia-lyase
MGGFAARKALSVVENTERVIAIEIICAIEAMEHYRPHKTTPALEAVRTLVRSVVPPLTGDR